MYKITNSQFRVDRRFLIALTVGIFAGFSFSFLLSSTGCSGGVEWTKQREALRNLEKYPIPTVVDHNRDEPAHKHENRSVADKLKERVRVLCWVLTQPSTYRTKADHVKATWGKRCNKILFISSEEDSSLPTVKVPVQEGRDFLWGKTKAAFRYVYEHHRHEAEWFLKADDDTYVVMENLRYMLGDYDPNEALYIGCRFKPFTPQGFMTGGAGYVLSKEALEQFINKGLTSPQSCKSSDDGAEDVEMGICMDRIGVPAVDTRDSLKRGRMFQFAPQEHFFPNRDKNFWYWSYVFYPTEEGLDCCSDHAISFHYIDPKFMYIMDYLIYHLRPYGVKFEEAHIPKILEANNTQEVTSR